MSEFVVLGQRTFRERLEADLIRVIGNGNFRNDIKASEIENKGVLTVSGLARFKQLKNIGQFTSDAIDCHSIMSKGYMYVNGDVIATDKVFSTGTLKIQGTLTSPIISIKSDVLGRLFLGKRSYCNRIYGNDVYIESIKALHVIGRVVKIGPNSHVSELHYSETFEIHSSSTVDKIIQRGEWSV